MGLGVQLDFSITGRAFSGMLRCEALGCSDWIGLGFAKSSGRMLGSTAVVKLPDADNTIKLYRLEGKSPEMVVEEEVAAAALCIDAWWPLTLTEEDSKAMSSKGSAHLHVVNDVTYYMPDGVPGAIHGEADAACPTSIWRLRDTKIELIDGHRSLHFTVDLPPTIALGAVHLIFAGGAGADFTYHGTERGSMTLDLLYRHYRYNSYPPPAAPPQPSCSDSTVESIEGYPCAVQIGPEMELFYHLSTTSPALLKARLRCQTCTDWVALGFPETAGLMSGGHALVATSSEVVAYKLDARSADSVQPLEASAQALLTETSVVRDENGVTMEFTVMAGAAGVPAALGLTDVQGKLSLTDVIFAHGSFANSGGRRLSTALSYHGGSRGGVGVTFQPRDVFVPSVPGLNATAAALGVGGTSSSEIASGYLALIGCIVGFLLGGLVVGVADRTQRCKVPGLGPSEVKYDKAPTMVDVSAANAGEEKQIEKLSANSVQMVLADEEEFSSQPRQVPRPPSRPPPTPAPSPAATELVLSPAAAKLVGQIEAASPRG